MGTNTRICSMALAALLTAACGGGSDTECGPGTIEVEDQCRPVGGDENPPSDDGSDAHGHDASNGNPDNPLIDVLPGTWIGVEPEAILEVIRTVEVNASEPFCACYGKDQPTGDACVNGFVTPHAMVLFGSQLTHVGCGLTLSGQVLENGLRVAYDWSLDGNDYGHYVWRKQ